MLSHKFRGRYVNRYTEPAEGVVAFETVEGNRKTHGTWSVSGRDGAVTVAELLTVELDAPVPRILKKPATLFAERDAKNGVKRQLERIKQTLES